MHKTTIIAIIASIIFTLSGCNGNNSQSGSTVSNPAQSTQDSNQKGYTGEKIEYYKSGQKRIAFNYKNGREDGLNIAWYPNGKKKYESFLKEGNGKKTYWYESGEKKSEIQIRKWKMDGTYIEWYKNGQKQYEEEYRDGLLHGKRKSWDIDGNLQLDLNFKKGKYIEKKQTES